jgi:3-oxoacyl-(acyl-carrier-protein) synthase III
MGTKITSIGRELPKIRVTNDVWREQFATQHELLTNEFSRFISDGIEQRFYWRPDETVADIGARVAEDCLRRVGFPASRLEQIITMTNVSDTFINGEAPRIQAKIGAIGCATFDLTGVACSGFLIALYTANALITSGSVNNVLIVCVANPASRAADHRDVSACSFGDLATAVLLERSDADSGLLGYCHKTRGQDCDLLGHGYVPEGKRTWKEHDAQPWAKHFFYVDHREGVLAARKGAEEYLPESAKIALKKASKSPADLRWFVSHQPGVAPMRIWDREIGFEVEKHPNTIAEIGNCSFATIPYTLRTLQERGELADGDELLLLAPGSGQHAASAVWRW